MIRKRRFCHEIGKVAACFMLPVISKGIVLELRQIISLLHFDDFIAKM